MKRVGVRGLGGLRRGGVEGIGWFETSHPTFYVGLAQPARYARASPGSTVRAFVGFVFKPAFRGMGLRAVGVFLIFLGCWADFVLLHDFADR